MIGLILVLIKKAAPTLLNLFVKGAAAAASVFSFKLDFSKHYHYHGEINENGQIPR